MRAASAAWTLLLLAGLGCSGGLLVNQGNAFPCHFEEGPATRDQACPQGWVCGVANACQKDRPEGLPGGLVPPQFDGPGLIHPAATQGAIRGVATSPTSKAELVDVEGSGSWLLAASFALPLTEVPFTRGALVEATQGVSLASAYRVDGGVEVLRTTGASALLPLAERVKGFRSFDAPAVGMPVAVQTYDEVKSTARIRPLDGTGAMGPELAVDGGTVMDLRLVPARCVGLVSGTAQGVAVVDSKGSVSLASPAGALPLPGVPPSAWVSLQRTADCGLWSLVFQKPGDDRPKWLEGFALSPTTPVPYQFLPVVDPCRPCGEGHIESAIPVSGTPFGFEVGCAQDSASLTGGAEAEGRIGWFFRVVPGAADPISGQCPGERFFPPFELQELSTAVDDSVSGYVAFGGAHGQVWSGDAFSTALPLRLDSLPQGVGTLLASQHGEAPTLVPLAFTPRYFALDLERLVPEDGSGVRSDGYAVSGTATAAAAGLGTGDVQFSAAVEDRVGWLITSQGQVLRLTIQNGAPRGLLGPALVDASGAPAQPPFLGTGTASPDGMLLSAGDSLYLYQSDGGNLTDGTSGVVPLGPQFTPQPGAPLRSLAVDRSGTQDRRLTAYALSSNTLFQVELGGDPEHWSGKAIVLSGSEPLKVWMQGDDSPYGRVGYRDGTVFTLPSGLPLAGALSRPDGGADRALDYANFAGWPVVLATSGLYLATPGDAGTRLLSWRHVTLPDGGQPWAGHNGKLAVVPRPDGGVTLRLFAEHGIVYEVGHAAP